MSSRFCGPRLSGSRSHAPCDREDADRHVDPEDPVPVQVLGYRASDQRAAGDRQTGDPAPDADYRAPPLRREGRGQQRQAQRHHDSRAHALEDSERDERGVVWGEGACGRRGGEQDETGHKDPFAAEPVPERGRGKDPRAEGDGVGVDRPLQCADTSAQVTVDGRQRGDNHQRVECHHEKRRRGQ